MTETARRNTRLLWVLAAAYAVTLVANITFGLGIPIAAVLLISVAFALIHGALWLAFEVEAAAEVAAVADRLGVTHAALRETVAGGALASGVAMTKLAKMDTADFSSDFSLEWALKDLDLADAAAGVESMPVAAAIADRWRRLVVEGYGRLDISAARKDLAPEPALPAGFRSHAKTASG